MQKTIIIRGFQALITAALLFCGSALANEPCGGAEGSYHTNPDGSQGGFVASTAFAAPTAYIGPNAAVCGKAQALGEKRIDDHVEIYEKYRVYSRAIYKGPLPPGVLHTIASMRVLLKAGFDCNFDDDCAESKASLLLEAECGKYQELEFESLEECLEELTQSFEMAYAMQKQRYEDEQGSIIKQTLDYISDLFI